MMPMQCPLMKRTHSVIPSTIIRSDHAAVQTQPKENKKRRSYDPHRRRQVAKVRAMGACLRCRLRKTSCSGEWPCGNCLRYPTSCRMSVLYRWMQCVPSVLKDLDIYALDGQCDVTMETLLQLRGRDNPSWFEDSMHWNVHDLCSEFVLWMFDQDARPGTTSLVGILSSLAFERLISPFVPRGIIMHLRPFIELTAFLYSSGGRSSYANRRPSDLWRLHAYLGSKVLQCLNKVLNNTSLEKSTLGELQAIFLVLFATLIAVGYSRRWNRVEPILRPPSATVDYVATQTQLLRVLAHHLIFIGRQTKVLGLDLSESQIIEEASCQWKRRATFEWKEIPFTPSEPTNVNTATNQDDLETDQAATQCRYHISRSHPASADCKPVGGFGTCIKDADIDVFGRELSPMDYILAGHQLSTTGGWLEEVSIDALDLDFSNDCSTTETTIFTPQSTLEGTPQNSERFGCEESWSSVKAQPDVPEFPGSTATKRHGMMKDDHHQSLAAATSTANPPTTRTDFPQNSDSSLTPKAYSVPPLSQGYDNLGGLAASLRSTNLIV